MEEYASVKGKSYKIEYQNKTVATVTFRYYCAHCGQETIGEKDYTKDFEVIENEPFVTFVDCQRCGHTSEVRCLPSKKQINNVV